MIAELAGVLLPVFALAALGFGWRKSGVPFEREFVMRVVLNIGGPCLIVDSLSNLDLPLADVGRMAIGGVSLFLATLAAGGTVSLGAVAACLGVVGIAVRQGISLVNRYQRLEREEGETFGPGLVLRGTRDRLAPILAGATAVGAAVLPLVALGDIAGLEILHPMAVAILGGLVTSAIMSLFVIPALYLLFASPQPRPQPEIPKGYGSERHA